MCNERHVIALLIWQTDSEYYKRTINSITNSTNGFRILQTEVIVLRNCQTDSEYYKWTINSITNLTNRFWILQTDSEYSNRTQNNIKWVLSKKNYVGTQPRTSESNTHIPHSTHIFCIQHYYSDFNTTILNKRKIFWIIELHSEVTNNFCLIPNYYVRLQTSEVTMPDSEYDRIR